MNLYVNDSLVREALRPDFGRFPNLLEKMSINADLKYFVLRLLSFQSLKLQFGLQNSNTLIRGGTRTWHLKRNTCKRLEALQWAEITSKACQEVSRHLFIEEKPRSFKMAMVICLP
jgi:hypothetical protein